MPKKIIVIGGGAAGMIAAGTAGKQDHIVTLIEKNNILGKKLLITGKGRCNITNAAEDVETLIKNVPHGRSFLYSAFYSFTNHDTIKLFNDLGLETKIERGNRVFPVSDKSADVRDALALYMKQNNVKVVSNTVKDIIVSDKKVTGVKLENNSVISADSVIVATGGVSYPITGSTGDGYKFAKRLGHTVINAKPSLVPLETEENWVVDAQGLSLKNIGLTVKNCEGKKLYTDFGELMFTHFGLSGPIILSASAHMPPDSENSRIIIDLKPALSEEQLDVRVQKDFQKNLNKNYANSLNELLPQKLIAPFVKLSGIPPQTKVNSITREQRKNMVHLIKNLPLTFKKFRPISEAVITSGGICLKEVNPSTMESKLIEGLFFAGEVLDVDAYTGGFNLQIAFSTGYLAGMSV